VPPGSVIRLLKLPMLCRTEHWRPRIKGIYADHRAVMTVRFSVVAASGSIPLYAGCGAAVSKKPERKKMASYNYVLQGPRCYTYKFQNRLNILVPY
jgi:hypothetical protein